MRDAFSNPFRTGARFSATARHRLPQGRAQWLPLSVLYYVLFETLAPFAILARPSYPRVGEGIAVAAVATLLTWRLRYRKRSRD